MIYKIKIKNGRTGIEEVRYVKEELIYSISAVDVGSDEETRIILYNTTDDGKVLSSVYGHSLISIESI